MLHTPPQVALLATLGFVFFLYRRDIRENPNVTGAIWIPIIWLLIGCSRPVSLWLSTFGFTVSGPVSMEEGSPLDACVYFALIIAGVYVLSRRQVSLSEVFRNNGWLMVFLVYCLIAVSWSDFPFVAFKRWIKVSGLPIMALVVLTEPDFEEAFRRLMKRTAYVIVPVSIMLIKYYPDISCRYDPFSGEAAITGIATGKNMLGFDLIILGMFFCWHLVQVRGTERSHARRNELLLTVAFLFMIGWLFRQAHSATSLTCCLVGIAVMALLGMRVVNKRQLTLYLVAGVITVAALELTFGISAYVLELLGRSPTLTDRTVVWANILKVKINPILGTGFESFWMGDRPEQAQGDYNWTPNEAHNGYLETYINLGLVGLALLLALLVATFRRARLGILTDFQFGRFRLGFLAAIVLYNWTEVSFRGPHPMWLVFYLIAMEYPTVEWVSNKLSFEEELEPVFEG